MAAPIVQDVKTFIAESASNAVTATPAGDPGDVFVAFLAKNGTGSFTPPAGGWTLAGAQNLGTIRRVEIYTKTITGTEGGTLTFTGSSSGPRQAVIYSIGGGDASAPLHIGPVFAQAANSPSVLPQLVTTKPDCLIIDGIIALLNTDWTGYPAIVWTRSASFSISRISGTRDQLSPGVVSANSCPQTLNPGGWLSFRLAIHKQVQTFTPGSISLSLTAGSPTGVSRFTPPGLPLSLTPGAASFAHTDDEAFLPLGIPLELRIGSFAGTLTGADVDFTPAGQPLTLAMGSFTGVDFSAIVTFRTRDVELVPEFVEVDVEFEDAVVTA